MNAEPNDPTTQAPPADVPGLEFFYMEDCDCAEPCFGVECSPECARPLLLAAVAKMPDSHLFMLVAGLQGNSADLPGVKGQSLARALARLGDTLTREIKARGVVWRAANPKGGGQ